MTLLDNSVQPDRAAVEAAVERIVRQPDFAASSRLCAFLKFVTNEALEGRGDQLKALNIAIAVYGRDETFDPQSSSIVRVEATRLRRMLERYFSDAGANDPVIVTLPRGSYTPQFTLRRESPQAAAADIPDPQAGAVRSAPNKAGRSGYTALFLAMALGLAGVLAFYFYGARTAPITDSPSTEGRVLHLPSIVVSGPDEPGSNRDYVQFIKRSLEYILEKSEDVVVIDKQEPSEARAEYRLALRIADQGNGKNILEVRTIHQPSGELVWSRQVPDIPASMPDNEIKKILERISLAVTRPNGVIFVDQRNRLGRAGHAKSSFYCTIRAFDYLIAPSERLHRQARECIEAALAGNPAYANGDALLSYLYVDSHLFGFDAGRIENPVEKALDSAQRAVSKFPNSVRAQSALFNAQFFDRRFDVAFATGEKALTLNPSSGILLARLGAAHMMRGDLVKGREYLNRAANINPSFATQFAFFRFLEAYLKDDKRRAYLWGRSHGTSETPLGMVARIIVAQEQGDLADVKHWSKLLQKRFPVFASDLRAGLERCGATDEIRDKLLAGLAQAGLAVAPTQIK